MHFALNTTLVLARLKPDLTLKADLALKADLTLEADLTLKAGLASTPSSPRPQS